MPDCILYCMPVYMYLCVTLCTQMSVYSFIVHIFVCMGKKKLYEFGFVCVNLCFVFSKVHILCTHVYTGDG